VSRPSGSKIFVHYADFALQFSEVWKTIAGDGSHGRGVFA
jgi:hypothetical protein